MKLHGNATTCSHTRLLIVERVLLERWTRAAAAEAAGVSERTAAKWLARYRAEGCDGLRDRSSAPKRIPHRTPLERVRLIELLRRLRMTAAEIAETLVMPLATVSAILKRIGLGKRSRLEPLEPSNRYECSRAGELVHVDVKKLARFTRPGHRALGLEREGVRVAVGQRVLEPREEGAFLGSGHFLEQGVDVLVQGGGLLGHRSRGSRRLSAAEGGGSWAERPIFRCAAAHLP